MSVAEHWTALRDKLDKDRFDQFIGNLCEGRGRGQA